MAAILALLTALLASCSAWEAPAAASFECPLTQECQYTDVTYRPMNIQVLTTQVQYPAFSLSTVYETVGLPRTRIEYVTVTASVEPMFVTSTIVVPSTVVVSVNQVVNVTTILSTTVMVKALETRSNVFTVPFSKFVTKSARAELTLYKTVEDMVTKTLYTTISQTSLVAKALVRTSWVTRYLHTTTYSTSTTYFPVYSTVTATARYVEEEKCY